MAAWLVLTTGAGIMEADDGLHSPTVIPPSALHKPEYREALPSSANGEVRCDCTFTDDGNASCYSVCLVPMVE